jgi:hypothetical protein
MVCVRLKAVSGAMLLLVGVEMPSSLGIAGGPALSPHLSRPLDIPTERLDRPQPEHNRFRDDQAQAALKEAEVVVLAKAAASKELGEKYDEYVLKTVVFDPSTILWSVTFDAKVPHRSTESCVIVRVRDNTKDTEVRPCS